MTDERTALEGLLSHPGWHLFRAYVKQQWGPEGYARRLKAAVTQASAKGESVEAALKAIDQTSNEVDLLQAWPLTRLEQLRNAVALEQAEPLISRRGPNL